MKKAFMLVAAIALLAAPVFAEVEVTISGEAKTEIGYNLDTEAFGMNNNISSDIKVVVGTLDGESMGEGNWYGVIMLEGAGLTWNSSADDEDLGVATYEFDDDADTWTATGDYNVMALETPDVTAKITDGNLYVQLASTASFDTDFVVPVDSDDADNDYNFSEAFLEAGSVKVGGTFAPVEFAAGLATAGDFNDTAAKESGVALDLDLTIDVEPIEVKAGFTAGFGDDIVGDGDMAFGVQVTADVAPLNVVAAFDGANVSDDFKWETGLYLEYDMEPLTVSLDTFFNGDEILDTKLTVGFAQDALEADASFLFADVLDTVAQMWKLALDVDYKVTSGIELEAGFSFNSDSVIGAYTHATFTELVDNVEFVVGWREGKDLTEEVADGADVLGEIFASAKISY